jgi:integrase
MAKATRDTRLLTRNTRLRVAPRKRFYARIERGLHLCYRRPDDRSSGTWSARTGLPGNRYEYQRLGTADDFLDADGTSILNYDQAQKLARESVVREGAMIVGSPYTVGEALTDYLKYLAAEGKNVEKTRVKIEGHIRPRFQHKLASELTTGEIKRWHYGLVPADKDEETTRRRKATANRLLGTLKAALNMAFADKRVQSDAEWRRVRPFKNVNPEHVDFPTSKQVRNFIKHCDDDFAQICLATAYTAARFGDLIEMKVRDFDPKTQSVHVRGSKTNNPRNAPLTDEALKFFRKITKGREPGAFIFLRADGDPWKSAQQQKQLLKASEKSGVTMTLTKLRHFYGSSLVTAGMSLQAVARAMGHKDTRTTEQHYARLREDFIAKEVRANLPKIGGLK